MTFDHDDVRKTEPMWRRYLRFHRPDPVADLDDELHDHLASTEDELRAKGLSATEARDEALRRFGDLTRIRREVRALDASHLSRTNTMQAIDAFLQDLQYATRVFRRSPVFTLVASLSIALAIAANTTIFSIVNAVLLRPIAGATSDNLLRVYVNHHSAFTWHDFQWFRNRMTSFDQMIGERNGAMSFRADGNATTERVRTSIVTRGYFETLGTSTHIGRTFNVGDSTVSSDAMVAVLSHRFWTNRFGSDSSVIGRVVNVSGQSMQIVGVMTPQFRSAVTGWSPDLFLPVAAAPLLRGSTLDEAASNLSAFGRVRRGLSRDAVDTELRVHMMQLAQTDTAYYARQSVRTDHVRGVNAELRVQAASGAVFAMVMVGMVLLIACANVANLLLARAAARQGEIGIRLAIGASRGRVMRQLMTESLLLALIAAVIGFAASIVVMRSLVTLVPAEAGLDAAFFQPDHRVLLFTAAMCLGTTLLFGLAPALRAARPDVVPMLKGTTTTSERRGRGGRLIAAQAGLCVVLLAIGSLFARSLQRIGGVDPGFRGEQIVDVAIDMRLLAASSDDERVVFDRLLTAVRSMPDVQSAALSAVVPLSGSTMETGFAPEGITAGTEAALRMSAFNVVSDGYFETMSIPLKSGRGFDNTHQKSTARVAIVNETAAQRWWPGEDPIGKRLRFGGIEGEAMEVIGVARNIDYNMPGEADRTFVYVPLAQQHNSDMMLQLRTVSALHALRERLWDAVRTIAPALPPPAVTRMTDDMAITLLPVRIGTFLLAVLGSIALLLAATGIYGVTAYAAARRTREIGIRSALGADRGRLMRMMIAVSLAPVARGALVGLVLSIAAAYGLSRVLYGVQPLDPIVMPGVVLLLALVAVAASIVPARLASLVDPVVAMRAE